MLCTHISLLWLDSRLGEEELKDIRTNSNKGNHCYLPLQYSPSPLPFFIAVRRHVFRGESTLKVFSTELHFIYPNQGQVFLTFMVCIIDVRGHVIPVCNSGHRTQSARVTFGKTVSLSVKKESQGATTFLTPIRQHGMLMLYVG